MRVERLGIPLYMYKRYVDDIIVGAVEPGAKIAGGCSLYTRSLKLKIHIEIKMKCARSC